MLTKIYTGTEIKAASSLVKARDMIRSNMFHSRRWLSRGLIAIYNKQTEDEQNTESTDLNNSVGFNSHDADQDLYWYRRTTPVQLRQAVSRTELFEPETVERLSKHDAQVL